MRYPVEVSRINAIEAIMMLADDNDPVWLDIKKDLKNEDGKTPNTFEVLKPLGITKEEFAKMKRKCKKLRGS